MLTKLRIKNFKAWGDQLWEPGLRLAPVTLLLGPNSAGKTSILQAPLLLKQTFESPDRSLDINTGGQATDLVDVGTAESLLFDRAKDNVLGVGFSCRDGDNEAEYEAVFQRIGSTLTLAALTLRSSGKTYGVKRQSKGGYRLVAPGYTPQKIAGREDARRTYRPERAIAFSAEAVAAIGAAGAEVQDLSLRLRQSIASIAYLGPLRGYPERSYLWNGVEPGDLGKNGENAAHALLASTNSKKKRQEGEEGGAGWLVEQVSHWLAKMGVADELILERQGRSRHYEILVRRGDRRSNLMDVGFGVSQVLPMLVLSYFVPQGTTIVAEQPEIHLHPRAQSGLAELMVRVAKTRRVQFLVETHSEHLFRRLQYLIAAAEVSPQDCALYYIERDEPGAKLAVLDTNEFGQISNWPEQFFGDAMGETARQMQKIIERMRQNRVGNHG
jgi:predicted ATPase